MNRDFVVFTKNRYFIVGGLFSTFWIQFLKVFVTDVIREWAMFIPTHFFGNCLKELEGSSPNMYKIVFYIILSALMNYLNAIIDTKYWEYDWKNEKNVHYENFKISNFLLDYFSAFVLCISKISKPFYRVSTTIDDIRRNV